MEILLPSMGSMAMAGLKGRLARSFSSSGEKTIGSGVCHWWSGFGFGGGASSTSIGGGGSGAGRGGTVLIVATPAEAVAGFERPASQAARASAAAVQIRRRLIYTNRVAKKRPNENGSAGSAAVKDIRLVPGTGIEPAPSNEDRLLRPARLPIPPPGLGTAILVCRLLNVNRLSEIPPDALSSATRNPSPDVDS